jgi:hypothetical protein
MIKLQCFTQSVAIDDINATSRMLVIAFGGGSGGSQQGDGWLGGVSISYYPEKALMPDTLLVGAGTGPNELAKAGTGPNELAKAGFSRMLNTIATGGGVSQHGLTYETSSGTENVYDNGVGAMGHWLSPKQYDRSTLINDIDEYIKMVWIQLIDDPSWTQFKMALNNQSPQQDAATTYIEYNMNGLYQPGAFGVGPDASGVSGAVFIFSETNQ